jgi:uncharacterized coiled-coil protein SlyX
MRYEEQKILERFNQTCFEQRIEKMENTQKESEQSIKILGAILTESIKRIEILENTNRMLVEVNMNLRYTIDNRINSLEGKMMLIEDDGK